MHRPECEIFDKRSNKYSICCGDTNLPHYKVDRYRERWGLPFLYGNAEPEKSEAEVGVSGGHSSVDNLYLQQGPGTELLKIYQAAGVPACEACYDLAKKMNQWGVEGCEERLKDIVSDIVPRAQEWVSQNKPWVHGLLPGSIEKAGIALKVKRDVKMAIENAKKPQPKPVVSRPRRGGCGCGK